MTRRSRADHLDVLRRVWLDEDVVSHESKETTEAVRCDA